MQHCQIGSFGVATLLYQIAVRYGLTKTVYPHEKDHHPRVCDFRILLPPTFKTFGSCSCSQASRHYAPQFNGQGLFQTWEVASLCLRAMTALQDLSPNLFEGKSEGVSSRRSVPHFSWGIEPWLRSAQLLICKTGKVSSSKSTSEVTALAET
jgi:hypothetical protein